MINIFEQIKEIKENEKKDWKRYCLKQSKKKSCFKAITSNAVKKKTLHVREVQTFLFDHSHTLSIIISDITDDIIIQNYVGALNCKQLENIFKDSDFAEYAVSKHLYNRLKRISTTTPGKNDSQFLLKVFVDALAFKELKEQNEF